MLPLAQQTPPRLMGCWLGHSSVAEARYVFQQAGIATYATPEESVSAFSMLVDYRRNQAQLIEAPPSSSRDIGTDAAAARALVQRALGSGRTVLQGEEAHALLAAYGIEVMATRRVEPEPYAAASAAERMGYPVALKIVSPDIAAGVDVGGLRLDLRSAVQVRDAAARACLPVCSARCPRPRIEGFSGRGDGAAGACPRAERGRAASTHCSAR